MDKIYYIVKEGRQDGPYSLVELKYIGIKPDTYVWRAGLTEWVPASQLPDLGDLFKEESAFGGYAEVQTPQYQPPVAPESFKAPEAAPAPMQPASVPHTNWLPWAIVGTVFGALFSCIGLIFGIIGIVNANKANRLYSIGDERQGSVANSSARTMTIISLVLTVLGLVVLGLRFGDIMENVRMLQSL